MTVQHSVAVRNAELEAIEIITNGQSLGAGTGSGGSVTGTAAQPKLRILSGSMPANCAASETGTLGLDITLPADWAADASSGTKAKAGTWTGTAAADITPGYYRVVNNAGSTCHEQGPAGVAVPIATNGATSANGNVLNFASTTGVAVGMNASGTGVPTGATVVAVTGTTVTLSHTSTAGVGSGVTVTFAPDLVLDAATMTAGQTVTINTKTLTAPNA